MNMRWLCVVVVSLHSSVFAQSVEVGPPIGKLVDIGERRLHLHCSGSGSPTVVIEAGASSFAIDFALVQPQVDRTTRVCSYDRAGSGWSDPRRNMETPLRIVNDLRAVLEAAGEKPPYVLVGASRGGLLVRLFQMEFPGSVVGVVLIDPSNEDRQFTTLRGKQLLIASLTAEQDRTTVTPGEIAVQKRPPQTGPPFDRLPLPLYETRIALERRATASLPSTLSSELLGEYNEGERVALARLKAARDASSSVLGDMPLVVLTRGRNASQELRNAHADLSRISRNGKHVIVPEAYHEIHLSHPDVVAKAVADVVSAFRKKARLH